MSGKGRAAAKREVFASRSTSQETYRRPMHFSPRGRRVVAGLVVGGRPRPLVRAERGDFHVVRNGAKGRDRNPPGADHQQDRGRCTKRCAKRCAGKRPGAPGRRTRAGGGGGCRGGGRAAAGADAAVDRGGGGGAGS